MAHSSRVAKLAGAVVILLVLGLVVAAPASAALAPGDLDPGFGTGGKATADFGGPSGGRAITIQSDGKIVQVGWTNAVAVPADFALVRYNTDGTLDQSFGTGGKVTTDFGGSDVARGVAIQSDGKIVAGGWTSIGNDFALARYNTDGTLDQSFGTGGKVTTDFGGSEAPRAVAIQSDGRIILAGTTCSTGCPDILSGDDTPAAGTSAFALARYNTNGTLDHTFGTGGMVTTSFGGSGEIRGIVIQADRKIVAAGGRGPDFALARYNTDGTLDPTFGVGGEVTTDFGYSDEARGVVLEADGKIVAAGLTKSTLQHFQYFCLARYNTDGTLDTTFGTGGEEVNSSITPAVARGVALEPDGRIVEVGYWGIPGSDFLVERFNTDGTPDTTFGTGGYVTTNFGGADGAREVAIQTDGKIVAAGYGHPNRTFVFAVARYLP